MADIRLSSLIAEPFRAVHADILRGDHRLYWLKGGRGSTKSSFVSLEIIQGLLRDKKANAVIYRKIGNELRGSVYEQMIWAIKALGLSPWFRFRLSPLEINIPSTGQRILFRGADDPGKSKSIKLSEGYFKYLWFEETTEFAGMDDLRTIMASILRGGSDTITFMSYNPPKSAQNWVNQEIIKPHNGWLIHHSDYTQVPAEWLGPDFIAMAEDLKRTNENAYKHMYLGEVTGTGGQVFDNLILRPITKNEIDRMDRFCNGLDFGFAVDADALVRCHYNKHEKMLYMVDEFYGVRTPTITLAEKVRSMCGTETVTCDSATPRIIRELVQYGVRAIGARKGPGSIEHGMRWLQDLAGIVVDPARCPNAAREFTSYEYKQDKNGNFMADYPDKDNHTIDACRYAMENAWRTGTRTGGKPTGW